LFDTGLFTVILLNQCFFFWFVLLPSMACIDIDGYLNEGTPSNSTEPMRPFVVDQRGNTLLHCCLDMNIEQVKFLIKQGQQNSPNEYGSTPFLEACKGGNLSLVKFFMNCFPGCISNVDVFNQNALDKSIVSQNLNLFMHLANFFPPSYCEQNADKLLRIACKHNSLLIFRKILLIANISTDSLNYKLVQIATINKNIDMLKELKNMNVDIDKPDSQGQTALFWACRLGHAREALFLVKNNGSLYNSIRVLHSEWCLTPLYYACRNNIFKELLWFTRFDIQRWEITDAMIFWARSVRTQYNSYMMFAVRKNTLPSDVNKYIAEYILPLCISTVLELANRPIQCL